MVNAMTAYNFFNMIEEIDRYLGNHYYRKSSEILISNEYSKYNTYDSSYNAVKLSEIFEECEAIQALPDDCTLQNREIVLYGSVRFYGNSLVAYVNIEYGSYTNKLAITYINKRYENEWKDGEAKDSISCIMKMSPAVEILVDKHLLEYKFFNNIDYYAYLQLNNVFDTKQIIIDFININRFDKAIYFLTILSINKKCTIKDVLEEIINICINHNDTDSVAILLDFSNKYNISSSGEADTMIL